MQLSTEVVDGVGFIRVQGEVDHVHAPKLQEVADHMLGDGARSLVIDCAEVTFMDSAGLSALAKAHGRADVQFGTITIRNPSVLVRRLLEITGLDGLLLIDGWHPSAITSVHPDKG